MKTKNLALIAVALVVLIACIAVPVSAGDAYAVTNFTTSPSAVYNYTMTSGFAPDYVLVWYKQSHAGDTTFATRVVPGQTITYSPVGSTTNRAIYGSWLYYVGSDGNYFATGSGSATITNGAFSAASGSYVGTGASTSITVQNYTSTRPDYMVIQVNAGPTAVWYVNSTPLPPQANFTATPPSGIVPLSVVFSDTSTPSTGSTLTSWYWMFGDGYTSTSANATHVYSTAGNYSVTLTIADARGMQSSVSKTITVSQPSIYYQQVNIVDITNGNLIPSANLSSGIVGSGAYHNWTGSGGSFNVTGTGTGGTTAIRYGDKLDLRGSAPNYCSNSKTKEIKIPGAQSVPTSLALAPLYLTPKSGELTLILDVYNETSGAPIYAAHVTLTNANKTVVATTSPEGVVTFANLSAADTHQIAVTYQGYADASKTVYAPTGGILYQSVGLTPVGSSYFWPVTIIDTSGNVILNSELDVTRADADEWYNRTSASGKFNVTGMGTDGTQAIPVGLAMILQGQASGYVTNGYSIKMSEANKGVTQYITLTPNGRVPISGEFSSVYSVYDHDTTDPVYYAKITQTCTNSTKIGYTNQGGSAQFTNMTVGDSCSYTASKTGYSTATGSFTVTTSGTIKQVDIALSKTSVNPTVTATTAAPTVNPTATGAEGAQNAIDLLGSYAYTFMILGIFSVFMWLFWSVIYNMTGGNIITKILKRGRR